MATGPLGQGLPDGVGVALAVAHLAVRITPGSGTTAELLGAAGIDAAHIAIAARDLLA